MCGEGPASCGDGADVKPPLCVLSVAEHAGWAHVVCVGERNNVPTVLGRRRVTLIDPDLPTQPYHHEATALTDDEANALIARVRRSIERCATDALQRLVTELAPTQAIIALAIRRPPYDELPETYTPVRESYRLMCAADGMLYQLAICRAARQLELDVQMCRRGQERSLAAKQLGVTVDRADEFVSRSGRPSGPPWTEEHRRAYAAGISALGSHVRLRLQNGGTRGLQNGRIAELQKGKTGK